MGRQRNIHSKEHLSRLQKSHASRPVGFYRKGGKIRPITKAKVKPKKTRVIKKVVNKPKAVAPTPKPKAVPKTKPTIPGALRGAHGWEFAFPSSSSSKIYTTTLWTEDHSQFKAGDISCNCPGWTRRVQPDGSRSCKHTKEVTRRKSAAMVAPANQAPANPVQAQYGGLGVRNAASATQAKFEKMIKGSVAGLPGFHIDSTGSIALLADVNESIQDGGDISEFVKSFPKPADTTYTQIAPSTMGKSVKDAKDPKDSNAIFIGDTTFQKKVVKTALKTLGTENIRVYSMGKDEPVFLVNNDDEAILLAPYTPDSGWGSYDAGLMRLEDVGTELVP